MIIVHKKERMNDFAKLANSMGSGIQYAKRRFSYFSILAFTWRSVVYWRGPKVHGRIKEHCTICLHFRWSELKPSPLGMEEEWLER